MVEPLPGPPLLPPLICSGPSGDPWSFCCCPHSQPPWQFSWQCVIVFHCLVLHKHAPAPSCVVALVSPARQRISAHPPPQQTCSCTTHQPSAGAGCPGTYHLFAAGAPMLGLQLGSNNCCCSPAPLPTTQPAAAQPSSPNPTGQGEDIQEGSCPPCCG